MRNLFLAIFFCSSLFASGQEFLHLNIIAPKGTIGSAAVVNVFLNDELAGRVGEMENLKCKLFSKGRITITVTYPAMWVRVTSTIDVEKGKTYYFFLSSSYQAIAKSEEDYNAIAADIKATQNFEEEHESPVVRSANGGDDGPKQGTGFLVNKKGYVLTNYHVISNAKTIHIKGVGGDFSTSYGADVIAVDVQNDLALLKFKNQSVVFDDPPYNINTNPALQGGKAFVLGYPMARSMGEEIKLTDGLISAKSGWKGSVSEYQFSAPIQPGNSGSPLFSENGDVIGIASSKLMGAENAGYAIKAQYILTFLALVENFSYVPPVNQLKTLTLNDQVNKIKNCIYIVKANEEN